jgi:hypothetical protein
MKKKKKKTDDITKSTCEMNTPNITQEVHTLSKVEQTI